MMNLSQSVWKPTKTNKHENTIENMISFIISIVMLIIAYYIYGKSFENAIGTTFIRMKMVQVCTK